MNDRHLVSSGVDKVLVVWNYETGAKIARFGQQPNISAGLHLVQDMLISITIDGIVRAYDIGKGEMIRQFKISDLSKQASCGDGDRKSWSEVGGGVGGSGMIQWACGSGSTMIVSTDYDTTGPISPNHLVCYENTHDPSAVEPDNIQRNCSIDFEAKENDTVYSWDSSNTTVSYDTYTIAIAHDAPEADPFYQDFIVSHLKSLDSKSRISQGSCSTRTRSYVHSWNTKIRNDDVAEYLFSNCIILRRTYSRHFHSER
jgi:hypothetical protein